MIVRHIAPRTASRLACYLRSQAAVIRSPLCRLASSSVSSRGDVRSPCALSTLTSAPPAAAASPSPLSPLPAASSASPTPSSAPPARVCIVGSGPAGMYTAKYLLRDYPNILLDIFEQLPVPFGLVRFGVAPDHPEVKVVQHDFQQTLDDPRVRFFGHVSVGSPALPLSSLLSSYHATVLAYGAGSCRRVNVPGSHLLGVSSARTFVDWYNGHPTAASAPPPPVRGPNVLVIGQGNVAIDCARLLLKGAAALHSTDVAAHTLRAMASPEWREVRQVTLLGRRGPVQAAFTIAEFREAAHLPGVRVHLRPDEVATGDEAASQREAADSRPKKRKFALVKEVAQAAKGGEGQEGGQGEKVLAFRFCLAPVEYVEDAARPGWVGGVRCERMRLVEGKGGEVRAEATGAYETLPASMVLESIGYMSVPLPDLPFDPVRAVVPQVRGRVLEGMGAQGFVPGLYVAGWLKRGPTGIIGSNIADARETVASVVEGLKAGEEGRQAREGADAARIEEAGGGVVVDKEGWRRIDEWERSQGVAEGRGRVKLVEVEQMLKIATAQQ